ncbi:unnamed protein product, partial [Phaeothamnion confervicola]
PERFCRDKLVNVLSRRLDRVSDGQPNASLRHHRHASRAGKSALDVDLDSILLGAVPRRYGEMPCDPGGYLRLSPGTALYRRALRFR